MKKCLICDKPLRREELQSNQVHYQCYVEELAGNMR